MTKDFDAALVEAGDPSTTPKHLRELSNWMEAEERKRLREVLAVNPNIEDSLLWELAAEYPSQVGDNARFHLLRLSSEPWWEECSSSALIQLLSYVEKDALVAARSHLTRLIWDELTWDPIGINLESHQSETITICCDLPATREGLVDFLGFIGVFQADEGAHLELDSWNDLAQCSAKVIQKTLSQKGSIDSCELSVNFDRAAFSMDIVNKNGCYACDNFNLEYCESSLLWELVSEEDLSRFESAEDQRFLEGEIIEHLFADIKKPEFSVVIACTIDKNCADLTEVDRGGAPHDVDPAELLAVIKSLGLDYGASIDLNVISDYFEYEIDYTPGGQGYWDVESVTPNRSCWSFDASLDGFGAGKIIATGPSGISYEEEVHEPGQDHQYQNPTLAEMLAERLCGGYLSANDLMDLLSQALQ
jgi:hypothetical protein